MSFVSKNLLVKLLLLANLFLMGFLLLGPVNDSPTSDEPPHLLSGYVALKYGQNYFDPEHPLLAKSIAALPLVFQDVKMDQNDPNFVQQSKWLDVGKMFKASRTWLDYSGNSPDSILFWSRLPMILLTLFFGGVLFIFTRKLFGAPTALVATFLYATEPIFLANGALVDTDIAATGFILTTVFALYLYAERQTPKRLALLTVSLAAAFLSKFSTFYLAPIIVLGMLYIYWKNKKFLYLHLVYLIIGTLGLISLFYGIISLRTEGIAGFYPKVWIYGLRAVFDQVSDSARFTYLLGHGYYGSKTYYFPVLIATKTQVLTLLGLILGIFYLIRKKLNISTDNLILVFTPPLLFFAASLVSKLNIGIRHVMPIYPFIIMIAAAGFVVLAKTLTQNLKTKTLMALVLLIAIFVASRGWSVVTTYPYFLSYYNVIAGGTDNGWKISQDSNYDWGQDVKRLADWVKQNNVESIAMDNYSGIYSAEYYHISFTLMGPEKTDYKGYVALSASVIGFYQDKKYSYKWITDKYQPIARAGKSIFIYKVK